MTHDEAVALVTEAARAVVRTRKAGKSDAKAVTAMNKAIQQVKFTLGYTALKLTQDILAEAPAPVKAARAKPAPSVPMGEHHIGNYRFTLLPSRWRTGMIQVVPRDDSGGYKGPATYLIERLPHSHSHRAGYTMSPANAAKLLAAAAAGDAYATPKEQREKRAKDAFDVRVLAEGTRMGGKVVDRHGTPELVFATRYGPLRTTAYGDWIAQRFDDLSQGRPYGVSDNGKWNFGSDIAGWKAAVQDILVKNNPKKRPINVRSAASARSEVRHLVNHDTTCPYPPEIGKAEPTPEGWLVRVTFRKAKWSKQTGFGPEFDRWYEVSKNSTSLVGSGPNKPARYA